jgi:protein TonB
MWFVNASIDKKGRIRRLHAVTDHPVLVQAAMDAVKQWRYEPYKIGRKKVDVKTRITVSSTCNVNDYG